MLTLCSHYIVLLRSIDRYDLKSVTTEKVKENIFDIRFNIIGVSKCTTKVFLPSISDFIYARLFYFTLDTGFFMSHDTLTGYYWDERRKSPFHEDRKTKISIKDL